MRNEDKSAIDPTAWIEIKLQWLEQQLHRSFFVSVDTVNVLVRELSRDRLFDKVLNNIKLNFDARKGLVDEMGERKLRILAFTQLLKKVLQDKYWSKLTPEDEALAENLRKRREDGNKFDPNYKETDDMSMAKRMNQLFRHLDVQKQLVLSLQEVVHANTFYSDNGLVDLVRQKLLKQMLKYDQEAEGIIISFSNVQVLGESFPIDYSPPSITIPIRYRIVVFSPKPGCTVKAKVSYVSPAQNVVTGHVFGLFNMRLSHPQFEHQHIQIQRRVQKLNEGDEIEFLVRKVTTFSAQDSKNDGSILLEGHITDNFMITNRAGAKKAKGDDIALRHGLEPVGAGFKRSREDAELDGDADAAAALDDDLDEVMSTAAYMEGTEDIPEYGEEGEGLGAGGDEAGGDDEALVDTAAGSEEAEEVPAAAEQTNGSKKSKKQEKEGKSEKSSKKKEKQQGDEKDGQSRRKKQKH